MEKKKILIAINGGLPLPAVKGGAVETLIDYFIDENEIRDEFELYVFSEYAPEIEQITKNYKNAHFYYVHTETISYKFKRLIRGFLKKVLRLKLYYSFSIEEVKAAQKIGIDFDEILIENNANLIIPFSKAFQKKVYFHLHNDHLNSEIDNSNEMYNCCKKVLTVSEYIKNRVETLGKCNKVDVLFNGIDSSMFCYDALGRIEYRKKYGFQDDNIVYVFSGRICEEKGVKELIEAFIQVRKQNDKVKLLIIGGSFYSSNNHTKYIDDLIAISNKYQDDIIFTGYVAHCEMPKIYSCADIQVVPSIWDDPCPLTVLEGLAIGLKQIVTDSGGIPEEVSGTDAIVIKRNNLNIELPKAMLQFINKAKVNADFKYDLNNYLNNFFRIVGEKNE